MSMIQLTTKDGQSFNAYFEAGPSKDAPGIVLIQEIFGVNASMRTAAKAWASHGYNVLCPDLFWRQEPGIELEPRNEAELKRAFELMGTLDQSLAIADLDTARAWLAEHTGKDNVGCLGYCLGGRLAVVMAMETPVKVAVSYYGVGLEGLVPNMADTAAPTILHIAALDKFVPAEARATILAAAEKNPKCTAHVYENVDHAFARPGGEHYDTGAAELAQERSLAFLRQHIA